MKIKTVEKIGEGFVVNGSLSVPNDKRNSHFMMVQKWIDEGGKVTGPSKIGITKTSLAGAKESAFSMVKAEAEKRIGDIVSPGKQLKMLARTMLAKNDDAVAEVNELEKILQPIRDASNKIENEISKKKSVSSINKVDISNNKLWP